jgi:hypothetical protein
MVGVSIEEINGNSKVDQESNNAETVRGKKRGFSRCKY